MVTVTSNTVTVYVVASNYGLVCVSGVYRCVQGAGNMTLSECESQPDFGKSC